MLRYLALVYLIIRRAKGLVLNAFRQKALVFWSLDFVFWFRIQLRNYV
jgi:hypothetical protein